MKKEIKANTYNMNGKPKINILMLESIRQKILKTLGIF